MAVVIATKRPDSPVRQENGGVKDSTRHGHGARRDSKNLNGGLTRPTRDINTELAMVIAAERSDRPVRQDDGGVIVSTRDNDCT
jgi:hypothetical protein